MYLLFHAGHTFTFTARSLVLFRSRTALQDSDWFHSDLGQSISKDLSKQPVAPLALARHGTSTTYAAMCSPRQIGNSTYIPCDAMNKTALVVPESDLALTASYLLADSQTVDVSNLSVPALAAAVDASSQATSAPAVLHYPASPQATPNPAVLHYPESASPSGADAEDLQLSWQLWATRWATVVAIVVLVLASGERWHIDLLVGLLIGVGSCALRIAWDLSKRVANAVAVYAATITGKLFRAVRDTVLVTCELLDLIVVHSVNAECVGDSIREQRPPTNYLDKIEEHTKMIEQSQEYQRKQRIQLWLVTSSPSPHAVQKIIDCKWDFEGWAFARPQRDSQSGGACLHILLSWPSC
jgi:hypothetical protein